MREQRQSNMTQQHQAAHNAAASLTARSKTAPATTVPPRSLICALGLASSVLCSSGAFAAKELSVCVFDPLGTAGDSFAIMKDYAIVAQSSGVTLKMLPYVDEPMALRDFKNGTCEAAVLTDFTARQFNSYTGSMNAIGAVTNNSMAKVLLNLMGNPKLDREMINDKYEVAGVFPMGAAYILVADRANDSLAKIQQNALRFGVLDNDLAQIEMVRKIGAVPVPVTVGNMGMKFNTHQVDAMGMIALGIKAFELHKGMGDKGAIFRFPVSFVSMNIILRRSEFPPTLGANGRRWFAGQTNRMMDAVARVERTVPEKYWMDLTNNEKVGYMRLMREMRVKLVREGVYNKKMTTLMRKIRCQQDPANMECNLDGE